MRYDVRTGLVVSDEDPPRTPGWSLQGARRYDYDLRIGDAERDAAMAQLREHFAAGRLTLDELTDRIDCALTAKTQRHIDEVMADLPRLRSSRQPARSSDDSPDQLQDAGRYLVLLLLLFALAAWLLMMAWMYSHSYSYPGVGPPSQP